MKKFLTEKYKIILGNLEFGMRKLKYSPDELLVLCMHSTPKDRLVDLETRVDFILRHFTPLQPAQLSDYFMGKLKNGPYVLFTFDDGLRNNLFAASLLEQKNIRAMFFIVPDFIEAEDQKSYYLTHIRNVIDHSYDKFNDDFTAMGYRDLQDIVAKGHGVGSHTMSHLLRSNTSDELIRREIIESGKRIEKALSIRVDSFCSPIHTAMSISKYGKECIEQQYKYHFTTFPGLNGSEKNPLLIYRRNIEANWPLAKIKFAMGIWDLSRWIRQATQFREL